MSWPIGRIEKDERIEVVFELQGDSESEYKVADAQDYHGATFGDEVDEEPNLPDWIDDSARLTLETAQIDSQSDPVTNEKEEIESISNEDIEVDLSTPQVQDVEPISGEKLEAIEESNDSEDKSIGAKIVTPDVCPVCGTEASVGASSCETCSFQFS